MTSWFKTGLWTPRATPEPAQKVLSPPPGISPRSSGTGQGVDKLESSKNAINAHLLRSSSSVRTGAQPPRAVDEQSMASHRAATLNDLLRDASDDLAVKAESIQSLSRFPAVAAAPVEGTKLTVLEHSVARLTRSAPRKGQSPSAEHEDAFLDATMLMQQYTKLAEGPLAAKIAPAMGKAAMESLRAGDRGAHLTTGLVQGAHLGLGSQRRQDGVAVVSRAFATGDDPVQAATQHIRADFERVLGGRSNAKRACESVPDVESYRREAVAELVLAGAARQLDIPVETNKFGRDGRVAQAVRNGWQELKALHDSTNQLRREHGENSDSLTSLLQGPPLKLLERLLPLYDKGSDSAPAGQPPGEQALREQVAAWRKEQV